MDNVIYLQKRKGDCMTLQVQAQVKSNIFDVARCFLSFKSMNHKKIQKLCYYAYAILLAKTNGEVKLFDERLEAWIHGPVSPQLYRQYADFGMYELIPKKKCPNSIKKDEFLYGYLENVYTVLGCSFDSDQLEEMTHRELPWINARKGLGKYEYSDRALCDEDIIEEFE